MAFRDYSTTPGANTELADGTFIGPNMPRNKVRPALQQIAADGRDLYNEMNALVLDPASANFVQSGTGAVGRTVGAKLRDTFHVKDYGAFGDGATNDQPAIQALIAYVGSIGGGDIHFDALTYRIDSGLDIKYPRVRLIGSGDTQFHDSGAEAVRTLIFAPFAGTSLKIRTPYAAEQGVAASATFKYTGAGCRGIAFHGGGIGTKAVEVDTVSLADIDVYATGYVGTTVYEVKCGITGTDLGEACDVYYSKMVFRARATDTVPERSSNILTLAGSINANVCLNRSPHHGITVIAQHWDGHVLVGLSADNNDISVQGVRAGGTGKLLLAKGRTAAFPVGFEGNNIVFATGQGAIYAEGTADPGVTGGVVNRVTGRDSSNSTPVPTAGTGSRWIDTDSEGVVRGGSFVGISLADTEVAAEAEAALMGNGSVRIFNGSSNHVVLTDGSNSWSVGLDGASIRFLRLTGTGSLNLGNGAPVNIPIAGLGSYANDAGAAAAGVAIGHLYRNGSVLMVRAA